MKPYGVNELRRMYLDFFESKEHLRLNSFSLVPHNDKSLLLINAGMAPLKPYFTGQEIPPRNRITTCQKCVRTGDIENVGKTARHLTFFEMLGNFSFGDYFKREAIKWSWEFLTEVIGMEPERLYPSIYFEDDEAFEIWNKEIGVPAEKITRFYRDENGKCDNFWEHGAGPCGPCSEIYYDRGLKYGCGSPDCKVGCECDRFIEVWNNVFTQFEGDGKGNYTLLEKKNIDTGMGLERLAVVVQDVDSVFDIDTMKAIRDRICELAGVKYMTDDKKDVSIRLITDHIRSSTFLISDGVLPSNEGRGYVLRRLIRRAARHGRLLGIKDKFLSSLCETVINESKDGYPELEEKKQMIFKVLSEEEQKFNKTIDQGLNILSDMQNELKENNKDTLSGENAFKLYDTFGFPVDLTEEILADAGFKLDLDGFKSCMEVQRNTARNARKVTNYMGADATVYESIDTAITSVFDGYDKLCFDSDIVALTTEKELVNCLNEGDMGTIITSRTPFYATMGGQEGDYGYIRTADAEFKVSDTIKLVGEKIGHIGTVVSGNFSLGDKVSLIVDENKRNDTCKNHSATHLLQKALRIVLGEHVEQAGSFVNDKYLRFDFTHFSAMSTEEIAKVEKIVNEKINAYLPVVTTEMDIEDAKKSGAMALFGEKYKDKVRVVNMSDFSIELCGGTHVENTGRISCFKIISENGVAAGVRRIEAITSTAVLDYYSKLEQSLNQASSLVKTSPDRLSDRIQQLLNEIKELKNENDALKSKAAGEALGNVENAAEDVDGIKLFISSMEDMDMNSLRDSADKVKDKLGEASVVVLAGVKEGKVSLVVMCGEDAVKRGIMAGNIIKDVSKLIGGGGGGRPNMAQAGGKDDSGINAALAKAKEIVLNILK